MFAIATGNVADGFKFIGPFGNSDEANEYADDLRPMRDPWWIVSMEKPEAVEEPPHQPSKLREALQCLTMAAFEVYANASDRDDVEIPDFLLDDYEDVDTYDEIKGVDLYPEWLELLKQARAADELLKNTTREVAATPSKSMYLVVVDNLLEYGYHPCQTMEEVEQVKQNYMSSETEVYRCELVESNGLFLG